MEIFVKTREEKIKLSIEEFRDWLITFMKAPVAIQRAIKLMSDRNLIRAARQHSRLTKDFKFYIKGKKELVVN